MDRRTFLRTGALGLSGLAAGGVLTGCGRGSSSGDDTASGSLRMAMYGSNSRLALLEEVFDAYEAREGGQSIAMDPSSVESYIDKLATQVSGGNAPDVMGIFHHAVPQFARQNAFAPLGEYLGDIFRTDGFDDGTVELGTVDGEVYGLSFGDNAHGMIFDTTYLQAAGLDLPEPGYTWEDLLQIGRDMSTAMGDGTYGIEDRSSQFDQGWKVFLLQRGKYTFTPDRELGFDAADLTAWLEYWQLLRDEGAAPPADVSAQADGTFADSPLINGFAGTHLTYANAMSSMQALTENELGLTTLPVDPDGTGPGHFIRGSNWVGIYARSGDVEGAVRFLDFAFNDEEGAGILKGELGAPPNRDIRAGLDFEESEQKFIDYIDMVADEFSDPGIELDVEFPPGYSDVTQAFTTAAESVQFGQADIDEAVDRFFAEAENALGT